MAQCGFNRREFLITGGLAGAATVFLAAAGPHAEAAPVAMTMDECIGLTPDDMARRSAVVKNAWDYIAKTVASMKDRQLRQAVEGVLANPAPTFMQRLLDPAAKRAVWQELAGRGYLKEIAFEDFLPPVSNVRQSSHSFLAAPGSGYQSHHAYPGGLVTHTALNLKASLALWQGYWETDQLMLDRDLVIASQVLHDLHKPWVFQWGSNGQSRTERVMAGTGEHHSLSVAESVFRGLPAAVCVAQACAHTHPGTPQDEAEPVAWIQAAGVLLGIDPKAQGLLAPAGDTVPLPRRIENFVCHLGDHDFVISVPAAQWMIPLLKTIAAEQYGLSGADLAGKPFNAFRNYVFSQTTIMGLYQVYATQGTGALMDSVGALVKRS